MGYITLTKMAHELLTFDFHLNDLIGYHSLGSWAVDLWLSFEWSDWLPIMGPKMDPTFRDRSRTPLNVRPNLDLALDMRSYLDPALSVRPNLDPSLDADPNVLEPIYIQWQRCLRGHCNITLEGLQSYFQVTDKFDASVDIDAWCNSTWHNP